MQDSSFEKYQYKKIIPNEIRTATLKALSFYPELKNIKIEFVFNDHIRKSVMQAQPKYITMYGRRKWRSYIIKISRYFSLKGKSTPIHKLPEDVLIGWIGHELGHIIDYLRKNNWSMILFGLSYYTSRSFINDAERVADTFAVDRGLGDYILATKGFILHQAEMPEEYIQRLEKLYLPPEEIMDLMENRPSEDG